MPEDQLALSRELPPGRQDPPEAEFVYEHGDADPDLYEAERYGDDGFGFQ